LLESGAGFTKSAEPEIPMYGCDRVKIPAQQRCDQRTVGVIATRTQNILSQKHDSQLLCAVKCNDSKNVEQ